MSTKQDDDAMEKFFRFIAHRQAQYWYLTSQMSWAEKQGHIVDWEKFRKERSVVMDELLDAGAITRTTMGTAWLPEGNKMAPKMA